MDDEKLLLLVQANECLYNKYSPGFKIPEKKRNIWKQISVEMKYSEELCQKRWSCLRDRYVKEKRQENLPSGSGAKYKSQWPLMQTIEFIAPYIVPRQMRCSHNSLKENVDLNSQSPLSVLSPESVPSQLSVSPPLTEMSQDIFLDPILPSTNTPTMAKRKRRDGNDEDKHFSDVLDSFQKLCESKVGKPQEEEDALTGFGKMIVATIRTMSQTKQIMAMQKVTTLVMELKLEPEN